MTQHHEGKIALEDTERYADDLEKIAENLGKGYAEAGLEVPPIDRLLRQAHGAWTVLMFEGMLRKAQRQAVEHQHAEASRKTQRPTILMPNGRPR